MCAELRLYLFGSPRLEQTGKIIEIDTRKAIAMLAYLVLGEAGPSGGYSRDALAAFLYPESDQANARGALRRTLSALRKPLDESILEADRERISIHPENLWVDVLIFRENMRQIKQHNHPAGQACPDCRVWLKESADLFVDDFMAGFSLRDSTTFDDWQFYQSDTLRQELAAALEMYSFELAAQGEYETAIQQARRWLALDPLREEAQRRLMLLYAWNGQRSAALRQYRQCVRVLEQELGVSPLEETTELYQRLLENQLPPAPHETENTLPLSSAPALQKISPPSAPANVPGIFPLVGRSAEWNSLQQAYQMVGVKGYWFALEGEAGIGKTRLADEFLQQVQAAGGSVMQARCYEGESGLAYAPFLDGLNILLAQSRMLERLKDLPPAAISPAAQLLPVLQETFNDLRPAPPVDIPGAQARFLDALRILLNQLLYPSEQSPVPGVLFLDDLQWADAASLDLLSFLIRRLEHVFILTAWRSDALPVDHRLRQLLGQSGREGRASSLLLPRLKPEHMTEFFQHIQTKLDLESDFIQNFYSETEGNPFFIVAYAESVLEKMKSSEYTSWELPSSVRDLLQARLTGVSEVNWQILTAASIIGRVFTFAVLREVSGRSEMEVIDSLEALLQKNLITEQRSPEPPVNAEGYLDARYDFTHDKLRSLVNEQTSLARRRLLHQRAAGAYASQSRQRREAWSQAAYHYRLAGLLPQAAECFRQAGEYARSLYANHEAIEHFQSALACNDPQPAELHECIGDLHALMGEYQAALSRYETAAALCQPEYLPGIEHKLGMIQNQRGDWELAECHYQSALEEMDAVPEAENLLPGRRSMIYADWSLAVYRKGDIPKALELAEQALLLAQDCQNPAAVAQANNIVGILERVNGHPEQAVEHLQRSLEIARSLNDPGSQAAALNNLARVYADTKQLGQAIQLSEQALELCTQRGDRHREAALHNNLADLYHAAGNHDLTMDHLRQAVVIFAEIEGWGDMHAQNSGPGVGSSPVEVERLPEIWKLSEW